MILLLGGTQEAGVLARALAEAGYPVLVSMASNVPVDLGDSPAIRRRVGPLDEAGMAALVSQQAIHLIVDATHPFAAKVKHTARSVAERCQIQYLALERPPSRLPPDGAILRVADHAQAARAACVLGRSILLTIGSRNVAVYAQAARERGLLLVARVLNHPESISACRRVGLDDDRLILGRGPFSLQQNRDAIRRFHIGVLVTKDSGDAGGVQAKLGAAQAEGCAVVMVDRPAPSGPSMSSVREMVSAVRAALSRQVWPALRNQERGLAGHGSRRSKEPARSLPALARARTNADDEAHRRQRGGS